MLLFVPSPTEAEHLHSIEAELHAAGWASFVTTVHELRAWQRLGIEVAEGYEATVDDYTNDLSSRRALREILRRCSDGLRIRLTDALDPLDAAFIAATTSDTRALLSQFYRIGPDSGWWMHRIPTAGPLRDWLEAA